EDAVDRAAARGRRALRDGRRRLGAEARAAVREGELLALGFARRVSRARRLDRRARREDAQLERACARRGARLGERPGPRERQVTAAQARRDRQPREPFLSRALLGAGPRGTKRERRVTGEVRADSGGAARQRGE